MMDGYVDMLKGAWLGLAWLGCLYSARACRG